MLTSNSVVKHLKTFDNKRSHIKKMEELPNLYYGEVIGLGDHDGLYLTFIVRDGKIELSDLLNKRSRFNFTYSLTNGTYSGRGTVNHFRDCERFVAYVLLLLQLVD